MTETLLTPSVSLTWVEATMSGKPSPLKSSTSTDPASMPAGKAMRAENEPMPLPWSTETSLIALLATTKAA